MVDLRPLLVGWREWASLPMLNTPLIKVKIDTGAKTSALHAYNLEMLEIKGKRHVKFILHPLQRNDTINVYACTEVVDTRVIISSNGIKEERPVIKTPIKIGLYSWDIYITLTKRDIMRHRMLLGREAMTSIIVDPNKSYCLGKIPSRKAKLEYQDSSVSNTSTFTKKHRKKSVKVIR